MNAAKRTREYRKLAHERSELAHRIANAIVGKHYVGPLDDTKRFAWLNERLADMRIAEHDREHGVDPRTAYNDEG